MSSAAGLLGNAVTTTSAVHVMETTPWLTAPFIPLESFAHAPLPLPREGSTEGTLSPTNKAIYTMYTLGPVRPDQQRGSCCSKAGFSSHSTGSTGSSVPVPSFSPLVPVHLVSPLQLSHFQAELHDYPDRTAAGYVLSGQREGFYIGFEATSVTLRLASSNMQSALVHPSVIDAYLEMEVSHAVF